jgi:hypothetical protein
MVTRAQSLQSQREEQHDLAEHQQEMTSIPTDASAGGNQLLTQLQDMFAQSQAAMQKTLEVSLHSMKEELREELTASLRPAQGNASQLHRLLSIKTLQGQGSAVFTNKQLQQLPDELQAGMPSLPVVVPGQMPIYHELIQSGMKDNGSIHHELPVLLTGVAVSGLASDFEDLFETYGHDLTQDQLMDLLRPGGTVSQLLNWFSGLFTARLQSVRSFYDSPSLAEAYVLGRFSPLMRDGLDVTRVGLDKHMMDAKAKTAAKKAFGDHAVNDEDGSIKGKANPRLTVGDSNNNKARGSTKKGKPVKPAAAAAGSI